VVKLAIKIARLNLQRHFAAFVTLKAKRFIFSDIGVTLTFESGVYISVGDSVNGRRLQNSIYMFLLPVPCSLVSVIPNFVFRYYALHFV